MTDSWDTIADRYADRIHHGSAMHEFARDVLLDALPADMSGQLVLDLGCGEGLLTNLTDSGCCRRSSSSACAGRRAGAAL